MTTFTGTLIKDEDEKSGVDQNLQLGEELYKSSDPNDLRNFDNWETVYRAPEEPTNIGTASEMVYEGAKAGLPETAAHFLKAWVNQDIGQHPVIEDWIDRLEAGIDEPPDEIYNNELYRSLYEGVRSLPTSMGIGTASTVGGGAAGFAIGGPVGAVAGAGVGGTLSFELMRRAATYEFLKQATQNAQSPQEVDAIKSVVADDAFAYGLWESVPELAANLINAAMINLPVGTLGKPALKQAMLSTFGKLAGRGAGIVGAEIPTEAVTAYKQTEILGKYGLSDADPWEMARRSVGPTAVMGIFGGAGALSTMPFVERAQRADWLRNNNREDFKDRIRAKKEEGYSDNDIFDLLVSNKVPVGEARDMVNEVFDEHVLSAPVDETIDAYADMFDREVTSGFERYRSEDEFFKAYLAGQEVERQQEAEFAKTEEAGEALKEQLSEEEKVFGVEPVESAVKTDIQKRIEETVGVTEPVTVELTPAEEIEMAANLRKSEAIAKKRDQETEKKAAAEKEELNIIKHEAQGIQELLTSKTYGKQLIKDPETGEVIKTTVAKAYPDNWTKRFGDVKAKDVIRVIDMIEKGETPRKSATRQIELMNRLKEYAGVRAADRFMGRTDFEKMRLDDFLEWGDRAENLITRQQKETGDYDTDLLDQYNEWVETAVIRGDKEELTNLQRARRGLETGSPTIKAERKLDDGTVVEVEVDALQEHDRIVAEIDKWDKMKDCIK